MWKTTILKGVPWEQINQSALMVASSKIYEERILVRAAIFSIMIQLS